MRIYNLTDFARDGTPQTGIRVKVRGVSIEPGRSVEINNFPVGDVIGLVRSNLIAVDLLPAWYQAARSALRDVAGAPE